MTWLYFKVTAMSNSFDWKFCVLTQLSWNCVGLLSQSSRTCVYHKFSRLCIFKGDNWCFLMWLNIECCLIGGHCLKLVLDIWIVFTNIFVLNTKTTVRKLPGSFVAMTDFEAGMWSIQILSECCSSCGNCYKSQKAKTIRRNNWEVLHKPVSSF